jgi:hypothetical protein
LVVGGQTLAQFSMQPIPSLIHFDAMILFFLVIFRHFVIYILNKFCHKFIVLFLKKNLQKIGHICLKHERVLKIFLISSFEYHQIWLNTLMDFAQANIKKFKKKKKKSRSLWFFWFFFYDLSLV